MVRKFSLLNEKNQTFSFMDIYNYCLLTEPAGLGIALDIDYAQLDNFFVENSNKIQQNQIGGIVNFKNYDNYKKLIDFIEKSEKLKLLYTVPYTSGVRSYYRDISKPNISKTELNHETGILSESITFNCLSLWYEPRQISYEMERGTQEIVWDFEWNSSWIGFNTSNIEVTNDGHVPAAIQLTINGEVVNPIIELYVEDVLTQRINITAEVYEGEKFLYSSKTEDFYIKKRLSNGTEESLFNLSNIVFSQDLIMKLPTSKTSKIKLIANTDIQSAVLTIFVYYKAV